MIRVEIDRVRALDRGVSPEEVMKCLVSSTNSSINFDPAFWIDPKNGNHYFLGTQYLRRRNQLAGYAQEDTRQGRQPRTVRLFFWRKWLTSSLNVTGPSVINHRNITRVTDVYANVLPGYDLGTVVADIEAATDDRRDTHFNWKPLPTRERRWLNIRCGFRMCCPLLA